MRSLPKVTFAVDEFVVGSPAQQLLDRFLIGYNRDGEFYSPGCQVEVLMPRANEAIVARAREFGLKVASDLSSAEAAVIVGNPGLHLPKLPGGGRCFVYGLLAETAAEARKVVERAREKKVALRAGTAIAGAFQLPALGSLSGVRRQLAVTYGKFPGADLEAVEGLWIVDPSGTSATPAKVEALSGTAVWQAAYSAEWGELFGAAMSRSNTIQGDPVKDGRTQDVAGLRLAEKLVKEPRAWLLEADGKRTAVFVLNGALEDLNVAFQGTGGKIVSTQLYRPPAPMQDHFSALAGQIEDFFRQDGTPKVDGTTVLLPNVFEPMRGAMRSRV